MKQIPFTIEAFGPDGMLKEGYEVRFRGVRTDFVKLYKGENLDFVTLVTEHGIAFYHLQANHGELSMYRRTRTAEEVAMETQNKISEYQWDELTDEGKRERIRICQAGMDEMKND